MVELCGACEEVDLLAGTFEPVEEGRLVVTEAVRDARVEVGPAQVDDFAVLRIPRVAPPVAVADARASSR
jgi:hypothetical protein